MLRAGVTACLAVWLTAAQAGPATAPVRVATAARVLRPGELVVLTLSGNAADAPPHVRAFDRDVPVYRLDDGRWGALVGIDLDTAPGPYAVDVRSDAAGAASRVMLRVRPHRFPTRSLKVDEAFVTPPAEAEERIRREAAWLRTVWARTATERLWSGAFERPVPGAAISRFGSRSIFNGQARNPHAGGDFVAATGTPVRAPNRGRVALAATLYFSGGTVIIDHGLGLFSMLAHLSRIDVKEGDTTATGDVVGLAGATGRVTGPHLHWAVRVGDARVDPMSLLALLKGDGRGGPTGR